MTAGRLWSGAALALLIAAGTARPAGAAVGLIGTERQVPGGRLDTSDPSISGNLVAFTDVYAFTDQDVWYFDLATGTALPASTAPGDQFLQSVSGHRIVYSDWNTQDVRVFDVLTGLTAGVSTRPGYAVDPSIGGDLVAWVDYRDAAPEIYARDLSTGEERRITDDPLVDQAPAVADGVIVWERCDAYVCDIFAYDWATATTRQLTNTDYALETGPDVSGRTVVFQRQQGTPVASFVVAYDLDTGLERVLSLPGRQEIPHVSGDWVVFADVASDYGSSHIGLWHLPTGNHFSTPASAGFQYLNDIDGQRVVYTDDRSGVTRVYLYEFRLVEPPVADAGAPQGIYLGETALLHGMATDPNVPAVPVETWAWAVISAPAGATWALEGATTGDARFTPSLAGDYVLSLVVGNAALESLPSFVTVQVASALPPVAVASADRSSGPAPLTVCFDASPSYSPQGGALTFAWSFGDGATSTAAQACHLYLASASPYTASVTVADARGLTDTEAFSISVARSNRPPVASPTATPTTGPAPLAVQFAANALDPDGDLLQYAWSFGDPTSPDDTSALAEPTHVYRSPGTWVAFVTVTDGQSTLTSSVMVVVSPTIDLSVRLATVKWWKKPVTGMVTVWADFKAPLPAPDDLVLVRADGIQLLAAPFSAFRHEPWTGAYLLAEKGLVARLDFRRGRLLVVTPKVALTRLDARNGLDVELTLGGATAVDTVKLVPIGKELLVYRRQGCEGDPDRD